MTGAGIEVNWVRDKGLRRYSVKRRDDGTGIRAERSGVDGVGCREWSWEKPSAVLAWPGWGFIGGR